MHNIFQSDKGFLSFLIPLTKELLAFQSDKGFFKIPLSKDFFMDSLLDYLVLYSTALYYTLTYWNYTMPCYTM